MANDSDKTSCVLDLPVAMGLRYANEPTVQVLAAILMAVNEGGVDSAMKLSPSTKHETHKYVKQRLKAMAVASDVWIPYLPLTPATLRVDHPALYDTIYCGHETHADRGPVPLPFDLSRFAALTRSIPMRCSNVQVRPSPALHGQDWCAPRGAGQQAAAPQFMQAMFQMMKTMSNTNEPRIDMVIPGRPFRRAQTAIDDGPAGAYSGDSSASPPESKVGEIVKFTGGPSREPEQPAKKVVTPAGGTSSAKRKLTVAEATTAILKGIRGTKDDDESGDESSDVLNEEGDALPKRKKTAAKGKAKTKGKAAVLRRPCSAEGGKAVVLKKPAAAEVATAFVTDERSRKQVRCRCADGTSFSFAYKKYGGQKGALAKARRWLEEQA
jgi:hypothetical protein